MVFLDEYSGMPLISYFQNFHETSLDVRKKIFITKKFFPPHPFRSEYQKYVFFFGKNFLFTRIWGKIMISIEMFRETMSLSIRIFAKFLTPRGGGGKETQTKENFELLQLRIVGRYITFFWPKYVAPYFGHCYRCKNLLVWWRLSTKTRY